MRENKNKWPTLNKPPVTMALFQLKFDKEESIISDYSQCDVLIQHSLPNKKNTLETNLNVPGTIALGVSKVEATSDTKLAGYIYFSEDQKTKLELRTDTISFIDEHVFYTGWDDFKTNIVKYLDILAIVLSTRTVKRLSIRFINQFIFDEFSDPTTYFNTIISTKQVESWPVTNYGFRILHNIVEENNEDMYAIVNQNVEVIPNKYLYFFDIDVLERINLIFNKNVILEKLEKLREVKNDLFFSNITNKTIELCN
jgi:uncharacterized protein (TIGR04255 family)